MEPAKIDWKKIESVFVVDELYEHFDAPKWVDLSSSFSPLDGDGDDPADRFFCRPGCKHPKTAEDFLKSTPTSSSKVSHLRVFSVSYFVSLEAVQSRSQQRKLLIRLT
ncbi:hypothetical protein BT93_J0681 [Corymbia citriodora subsp. variegata]|nr:hypothetical protein BT93_J0681 [Corymbia citriodora subsp. variegata]